MFANSGNRKRSNEFGYSDNTCYQALYNITRAQALRNIERTNQKPAKKEWTFGEGINWKELNKVWH